MSKELIGTSLYVVDSNITMKIPVQENTLPVQSTTMIIRCQATESRPSQGDDIW